MLIYELLDIFVRKYRLVDQKCTPIKLLKEDAIALFWVIGLMDFPITAIP
jgi:hypothetical protein